jgi:hypothetical protein
MKYVFLIAMSLVGCTAFAQVLGPVVYGCNFANGVPADWVTGSDSGISHWEYRGPNTTPGVNTGARGTCALLASPMASVTQSNGFMIFDSNYWDDGGTVCGGLGTGIDPAPHNAFMQLPPLDCSSYEGLILTFQQQYRHFLDSTLVEISINNGASWSTVFMNQTSQSGNVEWANVNISGAAAGESNVLIRFRYTGTYYWWLIDDIAIYVPNNNDLRLNFAKYTTNQGINSSQPYDDLEYDQYPTVMIPGLTFSSNITNIGAFNQTNAFMNVKIVKDGVTQIYNQNSASTTAITGTNNSFTIGAPYLTPAVLGDYDIFYTIDQNETDENLDNNKDTLDYSISPYSYARDEGPCASIFTGLEIFDNYAYEAGNYFQARAFGKVITAIGVAIGEGTLPGTLIKGTIYKDGFEEIWAETETHTVNYAEINQIGDEKIVVLPLVNPITTYNDSLYIAMVGNVNAEDEFAICRSGLSPESTSLLRYPTQNSVLYFISTPVVRLHIFNSNEIPGCNKPDAVNYDPLVTIEDGTCRYPGCAHLDADNYDPNVNWDDGSCIIGGCMDIEADNFNVYATYENGLCQYLGCIDPAANNYNITANVDDGSCVYINAFFQLNDTLGCAPLNLQVTNQTILQPNSECRYILNDIEISNACLNNFEYLLTEPGQYTLTYEHQAGEFLSSYSVIVEVLPAPSAPIVINQNPNLNCLNCGSESITWFWNDEVLEGESASLLNYLDGNVYQNGEYYAQIQNENGCTSRGNDVMVFVANMTTDVNIGCAPLGVNFENITMEISQLVCDINYGDFTGESNFEGTIQHVYTLPGEYTATLNCTDGNLESSMQLDIVVGAPVDIDVYWNNVSEQVVCSNPTEFDSITWYIGVDEYTGPGPFTDEVGTWTVVGVTPEGCISSDEVVVTGINELENGGIRVYPNPAHGQVYIDLKSMVADDLALYNALGECVWSYTTATTGRLQADWTHLAPGVYHLSFMSNGSLKSGQLIITQ